jgi:O-antigen/teichoic acid export membrane protein
MSEADLTAGPVAAHSSGDVLRALRNAAQLLGSLLATWGIALAVRVVMPRYLGPSGFGELNFADAFASTAFLALGLGVETYVRKEVSVRREHASEFWGGVLAARCLISLLLAGGMALVLHAMHRPPHVQALVWIFAATQIFLYGNLTLGAVLHAAGNVGGMSVLSVVTKLLWAGGIAAAIVLRWGAWAFAASLALSEAVKFAALWWLARKHVALRTRVDGAATKAVLFASLPFFVNNIAHTAYGKLDVSLLAGMAVDQEVGWYGAASTLAGLALMLSPLIGWVLMPLLARAAARSRAELDELLRRSIEVTLVVAIPASLALAVGADFWVRLIFGEAFAPAATALRLLAPMFVLTYLAIIGSTALNLLERGWHVTIVSFACLLLNPALDLLLIKPGLRLLGPGGGGAGCALGMLVTEVVATASMLLMLGRGSFDKRSLAAIAKCAVACAAVLALDRSLAWWGPKRLMLDAVLYVAIAVGTGAVRVREMAELVRSALRGRQPAGA